MVFIGKKFWIKNSTSAQHPRFLKQEIEEIYNLFENASLFYKEEEIKEGYRGEGRRRKKEKRKKKKKKMEKKKMEKKKKVKKKKI